MYPATRYPFAMVNIKRMLSGRVCWKKFQNVIFFVLVIAFCFTIVYQKANTLRDEARGLTSKIQDDFIFSYNASDFRDRLERHKVELVQQHIHTQISAGNEPIDVVYTWVNGSDPEFIKDFDELMRVTKKGKADILALNRYKDWGTLKYSLRSVEAHAPWIRNIYLVTNGQVPNWLALDNPRIIIVTHEEIFTNKSHLPAFTSPAIECHLHNIKGLSTKFIYMNDDILLTTKLQLSDFYTEEGGYKLRFLHERLEHCNKLCPANSVNNGVCEKNCTSESCEFDGDDCDPENLPTYPGPDKDFMFDSWGGSLMHTHFLFNKAFGPVERFIPEHTPHMFKKDILEQLIRAFPKEWEYTSAMKIRHHYSIQPEFAYYNYLLALEQYKTQGIKTSIIWARIDAEKIDFLLDNRASVERKLQFQWCKRELILKRPKFLVFNDHFSKPLLDIEEQRLRSGLNRFLEDLFPKPSQFEIT